ncbi:MAG: hypothetical protein Q9217_004476 [Psora testacea]
MSQDAIQKPRSSSKFHFVAGLTTGILSATLLQPADLLKTRLQQSRSTTLLPTLRSILAGPDALRRLWRGTLPSVIRTGFGSALYFSSLNALRSGAASSNVLANTVIVESATGVSATSSSLPVLSKTANLTTGAIARASAGLVLMPVTVIKVRYESSFYSYKSITGAATAIFKQDGFRGFFAGFGATAVRDAPYAGLYVVFYEESKSWMSSLSRHAPLLSTEDMGQGKAALREMTAARSVPINFISGIQAAALATAITNPFDAVKTRLQLLPGKYGNMITAGKRMVREEGWRSLMDGLGLRMGRKAISSALAWTVYEELVRKAEVGLNVAI